MLIGFVIGTLVIGLTIDTATLEKRRAYGVLKAIGFSNRALYGSVWRQSLAPAVLGLAVGIALTLGLGVLLEQLLPVFVNAWPSPAPRRTTLRCYSPTNQPPIWTRVPAIS